MHSSVTRLLRFAALVAGSALLVACAGPQVTRDTPLQATQGRGIVVVSVTHDTDAGVRARPSFLMDTRSGSYERRRLRSIEDVLGIPRRSDFEDVYGQLYVLDLEPGIHSVDGWHTSSGPVHLSPRVQPQPLTFEVRAGEVLYIGNLNLNHAFGRSIIGLSTIASALPEVRDRRDIDLPIAEAKAPAIKGRVQVRLLPLGPWTASTPELQRQVDPPVVIPLPARR